VHLAQQRPAEEVDLALEAARAASDKKAESVVILDVSKQLAIIDYFVICSGNNERQVKTIADEIERRLAVARGVKPRRREGTREARWVVLDYIDFMVHLFRKEERDYYDLERLWSDATRVPYSEPSPSGPASDDKREERHEPAATAEAT
jgi:ribosome-associated protein